MKRIRNQIVAVLLLVVLLPFIPLSFLVYNLVNQSYRVGVNPQVSRALESGVTFSKMLYNLQRRALTEGLQRLSQSPQKLNQPFSLSILGIDSTFWNVYQIIYMNADEEIVWQQRFTDTLEVFFNPRIIQQFQSPEQLSLIVSDRPRNIFTAIQKVFMETKLRGYLILQAALKEDFLTEADHTLRVHQVFQTLDVTRHFLPRSFLLAFMALTLFVLFLVVILGIWISTRITAPLSVLIKGTTEIGKGNLDYQLPLARTRDEFGQLIQHFNLMARRLKENQQQMIRLEKMAAWQQMARKLAHEIKNPLTPIQLTIQQLKDKYTDDNPEYGELLRECFAIINEEIGSLRKLVSEFSEFGRLPELKLHTGNINELVREVGRLYGKRVILDLDQNSCPIRFDEDGMRRVLLNLVENALQADASGFPVRIRTSFSERSVQIVVQDQGLGIPVVEQSKIFEPGYSTKKDGMGLGLTITLLIVQEHGGTVTVESEPGAGSRFIITLPLSGADN